MSASGRTTRGGSLPGSVTPGLVVLVRAVLLILCLSLNVLTTDRAVGAVTAGLMTTAAGAGLLLPQLGLSGRVARAVEAVVWAVVVNETGTQTSPYLTYLLAPALIGGVAEGARAAVLIPGTAAGSLLIVRALRPMDVGLEAYTATAAQWVVLSVAAALLGAAARRLQQVAAPDELQVQQAAHKLLVQLRSVARRLPGSLDPASTAEALLHTLRSTCPYDEGWVLVRGGSDSLRPLAALGSDAFQWDTDLNVGSPISEAWLTLQSATGPGGHALVGGGTTGGQAVALPLTLGESAFGIVALLRRAGEPYKAAQLTGAREALAAMALSLDTGLLFDDLRASATAEERARLAREIHDGVAQDIASLGYAVDALTTRARGGPLEPGLRGLREELTRVVNELRLSLWDLRNGVDLHAGLGAALSEHVRRVGASSSLTVHLSLAEGTRRLAPQVEAELLRIAQEAIANARKHSGAENLWVTCEVEPPHARLVIEDDGTNSGPRRSPDGNGLSIMAERAARIRAELVVGARDGAPGTLVSVSIGTVKPDPDLGEDDARTARR